MGNPMKRQDVQEAFLAALDMLAEDKKAVEQALSKITAIVRQSHEITKQNHEITKQSHEITKQSHEITKQSHEITKQSHEITKQSHEITKQSHETTAQIREIANLIAERLKANDTQHQALIRLVQALDTGA